MGKELFGRVPFQVKVIHRLTNVSKITKENNKNFYEIMKKYYDPSIETPSYKKGKHDNPFLGFNECALLLVLYHNTPNNSVPILWFESTRKQRGLFPRINRHSE